MTTAIGQAKHTPEEQHSSDTIYSLLQKSRVYKQWYVLPFSSFRVTSDTLAPQTSFIFQINEVRESLDANPYVDIYGHWTPSYNPRDNAIVDEGVSGVWWACDGTRIYAVGENYLPRGIRHYSTYSVFFSGGSGFRVLHGNAMNPRAGDAYRSLGFQHNEGDAFSSSLTNVLQGTTLSCHRADQAWVSMLLPNTYHGPRTTGQGYGGLKGELPIFLALVALSMPATSLHTQLPRMFQNGEWQVHNIGHGCTKP